MAMGLFKLAAMFVKRNWGSHVGMYGFLVISSSLPVERCDKNGELTKLACGFHGFQSEPSAA
jgi:hypothetical protein